jgi:hypothetical protein
MNEKPSILKRKTILWLIKINKSIMYLFKNFDYCNLQPNKWILHDILVW